MNYPGLESREITDLRLAELLLDDIPRYSYEPLRGPDCIRVLHLHQTKDRIECSIRQINVSDGGYQALSYVWGSSEKQFQAIVRNECDHILGYVPLTANLKDALEDLRNANDLGPKVFWIDQICINQESDEKTHQVAMMGSIYRNAARVITYIGPAKDDEEEKVAMNLMESLHTHFEANFQTLFEMRSLRNAILRREEFPVVELPKELQEDRYRTGLEIKPSADTYVTRGWRRLCEMGYGEWTQRLWMVQEQILNDNAVMLRGPILLPWDRVAAISLLFEVNLLLFTTIANNSGWKMAQITKGFHPLLHFLYSRCSAIGGRRLRWLILRMDGTDLNQL